MSEIMCMLLLFSMDGLGGTYYQIKFFHKEQGWQVPEGHFDDETQATDWGKQICRQPSSYLKFEIIKNTPNRQDRPKDNIILSQKLGKVEIAKKGVGKEKGNSFTTRSEDTDALKEYEAFAKTVPGWSVAVSGPNQGSSSGNSGASPNNSSLAGGAPYNPPTLRKSPLMQLSEAGVIGAGKDASKKGGSNPANNPSDPPKSRLSQLADAAKNASKSDGSKPGSNPPDLSKSRLNGISEAGKSASKTEGSKLGSNPLDLSKSRLNGFSDASKSASKTEGSKPAGLNSSDRNLSKNNSSTQTTKSESANRLKQLNDRDSNISQRKKTLLDQFEAAKIDGAEFARRKIELDKTNNSLNNAKATYQSMKNELGRLQNGDPPSILSPQYGNWVNRISSLRRRVVDLETNIENVRADYNQQVKIFNESNDKWRANWSGAVSPRSRSLG